MLKRCVISVPLLLMAGCDADPQVPQQRPDVEKSVSADSTTTTDSIESNSKKFNKAEQQILSLVDQLAIENSTYEEASHAADQLVEMGVEAFPVLVACNGDQREAHNLGWDVAPSISVGAVCRRLIQAQVEISVPKKFQSYRILNQLKLQEWWKERQDWTLHQMHVDAAQFAILKIDGETNLSPEEKEKIQRPWIERLAELKRQEAEVVEEE